MGVSQKGGYLYSVIMDIYIYTHVYCLGLRACYPQIMENHMEQKKGREMEAGIT